MGISNKQKLKKKKLKIIIRTSGGKAPKKQLGFGHVFRCVSLAKNLKSHDIFFLVEDYGNQVNKILKKNGFKKINQLENDINIKLDIQKTLDLIEKEKADVIIIDKYNISLRYLKEIKKNVKVVVISDLSKIDYPADLLVNGFVGFKNSLTYNKYGTKCLLGPKLQILNNEFIKKSKILEKKYDVLASFGGYDENNITKLLIKSLLKISKKLNVRIILGPATQKTNEINSLKKKYGSKLTIIKSTNNMYREMINSCYGLCSGGITTYEFAALNIPFGIVSQVKHQLITAREWEKIGIGKNLGLVNENTEKKIIQFLEDILEECIDKSKKIRSDGFGSKRISKEILKL